MEVRIKENAVKMNVKSSKKSARYAEESPGSNGRMQVVVRVIEAQRDAGDGGVEIKSW